VAFKLGGSRAARESSDHIAIFGLLVYLISFIAVIRQITRLADPYFATNDRRDLQNYRLRRAPRDGIAICQCGWSLHLS